MSDLWRIWLLMWQSGRRSLLRGAGLGFAVLAMGGLLLGLSGWFITAAAAAGLAGMGAVFDVFRPSALVRLLALGRTAARYGERLLTHDATLRALESLRLRLLSGLLSAPLEQMLRLRSGPALNRVVADVDALDGVPLRLALPLVSGGLVLAGAAGLLAWLVSPGVALIVAGGYLAGAVLIAVISARISLPLSRREASAAQAFRRRLIDLIAARRDLAIYGRLPAQARLVAGAESRRAGLERRLDLAGRTTGAALVMLATLIAAGALGFGLWLAAAGQISPARAAIGFFAALALAEAVMPLRRALAELGRMRDAARRVSGDLARPPGGLPPKIHEPETLPAAPGAKGCLRFEHVTLCRAGRMVVRDLSFALAPGESLALTGPSGSGKSSLLLAGAGLIAPATGRITLDGAAVAVLPARLGLLPQRAALMAGTIREALQLGAPGAGDDVLWRVLETVRLAGVISARGGLDSRLGPRGEGLSGGESRRLALARTLLPRPDILLLDEPTEGLDSTTAAAVLAGIRDWLPQSALLIAAHRPEEISFADKQLAIG